MHQIAFTSLTVSLLLLTACHPSENSTVKAEQPLAAKINAPDGEMEKAALDLLASLDESQLEKTRMPFDDPERFNFNFVPMDRSGLTLEKMNENQRNLTIALLKTGLSDAGVKKALGITQLESALRELEGRGPDDRYRHPELYYLSIFGQPGDSMPWGWRFEGHHLSLNFSSVTGELAVTPTFMGSNPGTSPRGRHPGSDLLRQEEEQARALLRSFDEKQRAKAVFSDKAPAEIITGNDREITLQNREGLGFQEMNPAQQQAFTDLILVYLNNMKPEVAQQQLEQIRKDGLENLKFAWAGGDGKGQGHYYRIQGPGILVEYDNTQNNANHIHTIWRDLRNDFGEDLLKRHYEAAGKDHKH